MAPDNTAFFGAPRRSGGVAIVTVMMIMAMMTTFAVYLIEDNHLSIRRIANQRDIEAAHQLAVGGEQLAVFAVEADGFQDVSRNNNIDYYGEIWSLALKDQAGTKTRIIKAKPDALLTDEAVGDGTVSVVLSDASGKFNINNLAIKGGQQQDANGNIVVVQAHFYNAFKRLLTNLGIDSEFADAVVDWIDNDTTPNELSGAEDEHYTLQDYRSANTPFSDIAELSLVKGFDEIEEAKQKQLLGLLSALPVGYEDSVSKAVPINLNTAPAELLALLAIANGEYLSQSQAEELIAYRNESGPFKTMSDFASDTGSALGISYRMLAQNPQGAQNPAAQPANPGAGQPVNPGANPNQQTDESVIIKQLFGLQSQFFDVETTVKYGRFDYKLKSTIRRYPGLNSPRPSAGILRRTRQLN